MKRNNMKSLYEQIMRNVSREVMAAINEAAGYEGMDPADAENLRKLKNCFASYKSKGGSPALRAKLKAGFESLVDKIVDQKMKNNVLSYIELLGGTTQLGRGGERGGRSAIAPARPTVDEPRIPVNNVEDEPEIPVNDEPEIEGDEKLDADDKTIMEDLRAMAEKQLSADDKRFLNFDNWQLEPDGDGYRIMCVSTIYKKAKNKAGEMVDLTAKIEEAADACDAKLKGIIAAINDKYTEQVDTCLYDIDDNIQGYGIGVCRD